MEFSFYSPVKLVFGQPVATALPAVLAEIGVERILVLSDAGLEADDIDGLEMLAGKPPGARITWVRARTPTGRPSGP